MVNLALINTLPSQKGLDVGLKPHLHGRLFCNAIRRFFMRENLSRKAVTHTRQDSLAAIAFGKNRCRVSNTCDLRCRLYFCATRCNNRSRPWSLTRGRFQRLESHKTKSRSCKQQIVSQFTSRPGIAQCTNALRVAGCDYLSLLHKILCSWYKIGL